MTAAGSPPLLALRAGRAWDPVAGRRDGPVTVVCDPAAGTIVAVATGDPPEGGPVEVVDYGERATLLPGLVDAHIHLCLDPGADIVAHCLQRTDDELAATARQAARRALAAGITTVRDLGDRRYVTLGLRAEAREHPGQLPEVLVAGPPITPAQGHCWFLGGEATGAAELAAAVDERAERRVDVVKVMATGGLLTPGFGMHESQYTLDDLRVVVDRAHGHGLAVTAHAHGGPGVADALAAGCDGIEHATFVTADGVDCDWRTVERMAARGVTVGATEAWLPAGEPLPPAAARRVEQVWANFARMHAMGVRLAVTSDGGIHPRKPHDALPHGAVLFAGLGLSNHEAMETVTAAPAWACGLATRKGRLAAGYDADLLAVDGDPVADISALLRPRAVVRAGWLVGDGS